MQPVAWNNDRLLDDPFIWLDLVSENPWMALECLDIDFQDFRRAVAYECRHVEGNVYYWIIPRIIMPADFEWWQKHMITQGIPDHARDYEFFRWFQFGLISQDDREEALGRIRVNPEPNSVAGTMMGHGYMRVVFDGGRSKCPVIVKLSDGSDLVCSCWTWHAK